MKYTLNEKVRTEQIKKLSETEPIEKLIFQIFTDFSLSLVTIQMHERRRSIDIIVVIINIVVHRRNESVWKWLADSKRASGKHFYRFKLFSMTARRWHLRIQNSFRKFANAFESTLSIRIHLPADKIPCANTWTLIKFRLRSAACICVIKMLAEWKTTTVDKWTRNGGLEFGKASRDSNFHLSADKNTRDMKWK